MGDKKDGCIWMRAPSFFRSVDFLTLIILITFLDDHLLTYIIFQELATYVIRTFQLQRVSSAHVRPSLTRTNTNISPQNLNPRKNIFKTPSLEVFGLTVEGTHTGVSSLNLLDQIKGSHFDLASPRQPPDLLWNTDGLHRSAKHACVCVHTDFNHLT